MTRAGCQCEDVGNVKRLPRLAGVIMDRSRIDLAAPAASTTISRHTYTPCAVQMAKIDEAYLVAFPDRG
jgi:hypothetical protein